MRLSKFFLILGIVVLLVQSSCKKDTGPVETSPSSGPILAIYPSSDYINLPDSIRDLNDIVKIQDASKLPHTLKSIILPYNCPLSFAIANIGPEESTLNYTIVDSGALVGFLNFDNGNGSPNIDLPNIPVSGSLKGGHCATINVTVDSRFTDASFGGLVGATLGLFIHTPQASNRTGTWLGIGIESINDEAQKLCGIWSGTWSADLPIMYPHVQVSGTWSLNLESVDFANGTASGILNWSGHDAYWVDSTGGRVIHDIYPNETIIFNSSNAILQLHNYMDGVSRPCEGGFDLIINKVWVSEGDCGLPYGPQAYFALSTHTADLGVVGSSNWGTHPGNCNYNKGQMYGKKSP